MRVRIVTIFPEMVQAALTYGVIGRAQEAGVLDVRAVNLREFTEDRHRTTDDTSYGGGGGMVMLADPFRRAVQGLTREGTIDHIILTDPQGEPFSQAAAEKLAKSDCLVFLCGRYEGVDDRVRRLVATDVFSIGDYVLSGGELAALVMIDAIARLIPGVVGWTEATAQDTFCGALLDYPQFARPAVFEGVPVPRVLLDGNHQDIADWRRFQQLDRTRRWRPDLWAEAELTMRDLELLAGVHHSDL